MQHVATLITFFLVIAATSAAAQANSTFVQKVVEQVKAAHPEIIGLELAATKPGEGCQTIAATERAEIGEKCDEDELTAMKTNRPYVEQEKTEFDVTLPIHDRVGKVFATAGMDFKLEAKRSKETTIREALNIGAELERRLSSESDLFKPPQ